MGVARTGGGDKPSIAPEKTLGRGPICSAAFSLRKPPRNSLILRHGVLTKLPLSRPPRCVASASKSSAPLTRPSPQVSHPIPPRHRPWHELCISASLCVAAVSRIGSALAGLGRGPHPLRQTTAGFQAFFRRPPAPRVQQCRRRADMKARNAWTQAWEVVPASRQHAGGRSLGDTAAVGRPVWGG